MAESECQGGQKCHQQGGELNTERNIYICVYVKEKKSCSLTSLNSLCTVLEEGKEEGKKRSRECVCVCVFRYVYSGWSYENFDVNISCKQIGGS